MLVKITDDNAEAQVKSIKYRNWVSIGLPAAVILVDICCLNHENGSSVALKKFIYACFLCDNCWFVVEVISSVTEYYTGLGTNQLWQLYKKSSLEQGQTIAVWQLE
jgi:Na+/H+-translocating membrane pyrophosphatase